jgi:hypothetical protein
MGDSDLEFYTREALKEGDAKGYARATADIVSMLRDDLLGLITMSISDAREAEDRRLVADCIQAYVDAIKDGKHVGRAKK